MIGKLHYVTLALGFSCFFTQVSAQNTLLDLKVLSDAFEYEMRYATANNFLGEILYECPKCLLRPDVANSLVLANQFFCENGYRIKIFDCYRPLDVQKKMWAKVPRATYIANPYGKGSIHNKAAAVDITLVTSEGCFVDMGTDFDSFSKESHIDAQNLSVEIIKNRKLLFEGMKKFGFMTIRTEWWHFSYLKNGTYTVLNTPLPCSD